MYPAKFLSKIALVFILSAFLPVLFGSSAVSKVKTIPTAARKRALLKPGVMAAHARGLDYNVPKKKPVRPGRKMKSEKPVPQATSQSGKLFIEAQVRVDKKFTIDYLKGLPTAPKSVPEVLRKPARVVLQLPAEQFTALVKEGADARIIRKFIVAGSSKPNPKNTKATGSCYSYNSEDVYVPDYDGGWVYSDIPISCAPAGATVTSIDVYFQVYHSFVGDLLIDLTDEDQSCERRLFDDINYDGTYLFQTVNDIIVCNGEPANQTWYLWAQDTFPGDTGYIDYWTITVYYEDSGCTPPANDDCGNAIAVSKDVPYYGSTDCATGTDITSCGSNDTADVWHSFTPATTSDYTISLCGSTFDTTLGVFSQCWTGELACNDDSDSCGGGSYQSEVTLTLTAGYTYLIRVSGYDEATGDYTLLVTGGENNDECENAAIVTANMPYDGSSAGATGTDITSCGSNDTADVWHSFTPAASSQYTISLCGSAFDTTLAVFDDCGGTELACNDNSCGLQSEVELALTAGQEYLIRVSGNNGVTGDYTLLITKNGDGITNYYAVVCGISDYLHNDVAPDLTYCDDDAWDVRNALLTWSNWDSSNITMLIDSAATKSAIHTAIQNMAAVADEDDVCLFFFSGHGSYYDEFEAPYDESDGYDEYLIPYETYYIDDAISDDEFGDWIDELPTDKYIILLDACNSGGQVKGIGLNGETPKVKGIGDLVTQKGDGFAADLIRQISAKDLDDNNRGVVVTASDDDEESWEIPALQNSLFTYYLVEGMLGPADSDSDDMISAEECHSYTSPLAASYPGIPPGEEQHAQIYDAYPGEFDFLGVAPPPPTPHMESCEIAASHGGAGEISYEIVSGYIEPRTYGIKKLYVYFDMDMDTSVVDISEMISIDGISGGAQAVTGSVSWDSSICMVIELTSALPDMDVYTITLKNAIKSALGAALEESSMCVTALKGDANANRSVNSQDLLAVRAHINESVESSNARYDINCNGSINSQDLLAARSSIGNSTLACP